MPPPPHCCHFQSFFGTCGLCFLRCYSKNMPMLSPSYWLRIEFSLWLSEAIRPVAIAYWDFIFIVSLRVYELAQSMPCSSILSRTSLCLPPQPKSPFLFMLICLPSILSHSSLSIMCWNPILPSRSWSVWWSFYWSCFLDKTLPHHGSPTWTWPSPQGPVPWTWLSPQGPLSISSLW